MKSDRDKSEVQMDISTQQINHLDLPMIGAQVFIEPGQSPDEIDSWFRILSENHLPICRIRLFETYMRKADGEWDFSLFDLAFRAAEKYGVKIFGTLFPATPFTDVGGFKFPRTQAHLEEIATYIRNLVTHFRSSSALFGWVLINEPGVGKLPDEEFSQTQLDIWRKKQSPHAYQSKGYNHFTFDQERFLLDYNTWFLNWLAEEIQKYDPGRHVHVNNHAIFSLVADYDFPSWRPFLNSLGGSAHASWHFGYFQREQYALAMAADCEIIRSGAGDLPWLMTEIQGGNNVYSGGNPLCPTKEEINQWLWTIIGSGGKGGIFWCLNPRASGFEAGEWALIDFQNEPSDRLRSAASVSRIIQENENFFNQANPVTAPIHILYVRESLWVEQRLQRGGTYYEGREVGGVMKSALSYFETINEMGISCHLREISEFDFSQLDYRGVTLILAHQVSLPSRYWQQLEDFVQCGGKLILDGLTAYYDENAHCIMKTGFPLAELCGASIKEFKLLGNLFEVNLTSPDITLPGHCWQGTLRCYQATPMGFAGDEITACRHSFGQGEIIWIPSLLGLGARLDSNTPLATFLSQEICESILSSPFRFGKHQPGLLQKTLFLDGAYLNILINKNQESVDIDLILPETLPADCQPKILFSDRGGRIVGRNRFHLPPEETLVLKWE